MNTIKTALLLGVLSALLMFIGEAIGGGQGLMIGFFFAAAMKIFAPTARPSSRKSISKCLSRSRKPFSE